MIEVNPAVPDPSSVSVFTPTVTDNAPAPLETSLSQTDVGWSWQTGSPAPAAASIYMGASLGFTVTGSRVSWLSVTPAESTGPATLFLQPDLAQLAPGVYTTTALVTPTVPAGLPAYPVMPTVISISVTVSAAPLISASLSYMDFSALFPIGSAVAQSTLKLGSNGQPAAFTVVARTTSGGQWLSVTPSSGTAPATLTVTASLTGLGSGIYGGDLAIQGPGNTLHVMVNLTIFPLPGPPAPSGLATSPEVLVFYLPAGAAAPASSATDLRAAGGRLRSGFGANGNRHGVAWRRGDCQRAQPGRRGSKCQCGQHGAGHLYRERSSFPRPHWGSIQIPRTLYAVNDRTEPTITPSARSRAGMGRPHAERETEAAKLRHANEQRTGCPTRRAALMHGVL
jgi:hypothetical protein